MKNKFIYLFLIIFIFVFNSCATTLHVNVTRPAKLDLYGAKTIGVLSFDLSNKNPFNYFFNGSEDGIENYFNYYGEISRVERNIVNYLQDNIESGISKSSYISLVDSNIVKKSLKYGGKNPADVIIGGEIVTLNVYDNQYKEKKLIPEDGIKDNNKPEYYYDYTYSRDVELIFNYEIVDGRTKNLIFSDTIKIANSSDRYDETKLLPNIFSLVNYDLDIFIDNLIKDIQPYSINKSIKLLEDKSDNPLMENADKLANDGYYRESYSEFAKIYIKTGLFEAGYNGAMMLIVLGELESAETMMSEVYSKSGDSRALDALYDIRNEIKQAEILNNQINHINVNSKDDLYEYDYIN